MKLTKHNSIIYLFAVLMMLFSCGEKEVEYVDYQVNFFKDSPYFIYTPPTFETITEQVLLREQHKQGATFTDVSTQVLASDGWNSKKVGEESTVELVTDLELNTVQSVTCRDFFQVVELINEPIPAQYTTITHQEVLVNGTGANVDAVYTTRSYRKLYEDAKYEPIPNTNPISNTFTFRLPVDMPVADYIQNTFRDSIQANCIEAVGFSIQ